MRWSSVISATTTARFTVSTAPLPFLAGQTRLPIIRHTTTAAQLSVTPSGFPAERTRSPIIRQEEAAAAAAAARFTLTTTSTSPTGQTYLPIIQQAPTAGRFTLITPSLFPADVSPPLLVLHPCYRGGLSLQTALYTNRDFFYPIRMVFHPFNGQQTRDFWTVRQEMPGRPEYRLHVEFPPVATPPEESPTIEPRIAALQPIALQSVALLEAALFLAKEPMSSRRLAQLAGLPEGTKTLQLIRELNKRYDQDQSAFCITEVAGGFQLRTRPEFAAWLVRMQTVPTAVRLSNPAMETLTVIAYRQPVPRTEVERIRGVQCGDLIRQLLDQDLIKIAGRSEELGRPFLYGTTTRFLQIFGLGSLNDLPALDTAPGESASYNRADSAAM